MKKNLMSVLLILCMMFLTVPQNVAAANITDINISAMGENEPDVNASTAYKHSGSLEMSKLSKAEILRLLETNSLMLPSEMFEITPLCTAPYSTGKVKDEALQVAVNRLNALRRIAGLPSVVLDNELCANAQYGAVLLATPGVPFGHYPGKPSDMDDAFYEQGLTATSSSNLYAGVSLSYATDGFMDDSDAGNVQMLGHRRWQLNPTMGKVGFGYAENASTRYHRYTVEKVFDRSGAGCDYDFIGWPASGNFPSSHFEEHVAWSVTLNPKKYQTPKAEDISVVLVRDSDGAKWNFYGSNYYQPTGSGEYFNVNTGGYGVSNCIIFRPDGISTYDGVYTVRIYGIKDIKGNAVDFAYKVDFFDEADAESIPLTESMFVVDTSAEVYNGKAKSKTITSSLTENVDYTVSYVNNVNAGTAIMYISGMGNYTGTITKTFMIEKAPRNVAASTSSNLLYVYGHAENIYVYMDNALADTPKYRYVSSNTEVAMVDAEGHITPVGPGMAQITIVADETANYLAGSMLLNIEVKYATIGKTETNRGNITVDTEKAYVGQKVTFRVTPNEGYWLYSVSATKQNGDKITLERNEDDSYSFYVPNSDVNIWATFKLVIPEHDCTITHFGDIDLYEWYHYALEYVVAEELMQGTSETLFEPNTRLTRAMLAQILYSREGKPEVEEKSNFSDVHGGEWYEDAVNWAASIGIVSGYPEGGFLPNVPISREQVALILYNYAVYKGYDVSVEGDLSQFADGSTTHGWAWEAMEWALGAGLLNGKSETILDPTATATRAEIAQILRNFCTTVAEQEDGAEE